MSEIIYLKYHSIPEDQALPSADESAVAITQISRFRN
jgi:hypothetical protein